MQKGRKVSTCLGFTVHDPNSEKGVNLAENVLGLGKGYTYHCTYQLVLKMPACVNTSF